MLQKWKQLCIEHEADLALLITVENGKPFHEAKGEVSRDEGWGASQDADRRRLAHLRQLLPRVVRWRSHEALVR